MNASAAGICRAAPAAAIVPRSAEAVVAAVSVEAARGRAALGDLPVLAAAFAEQAREKKSVILDPQNKNRAILAIGTDDWPFAVPIVRKAGIWSFDAAAGRNELLYRRIGANELDAIQFCRGYVEAQQEYALRKRGDSRVNQYAQRIIGMPGKQDGWAWQNPDGTWDGPVGEKVARIIEQGYSRTEPYHGYFFKVLKGQGPAAPLGELDFLVSEGWHLQ